MIVTSTGTYEEHLADVEIVIKRLHKAGLKCKIDKCMFAKPEIEYLGYIITKEGVKPNPNKVQAIIDLQRPSSKTEVRHFLGMVQYYRDVVAAASSTIGMLRLLSYPIYFMNIIRKLLYRYRSIFYEWLNRLTVLYPAYTVYHLARVSYASILHQSTSCETNVHVHQDMRFTITFS